MAGYSIDVSLSQAIPLGHKFALRDIEAGEPVIKYGEVIGLATQTNAARPTKAS
jgi:altronate dehydratase